VTDMSEEALQFIRQYVVGAGLHEKKLMALLESAVGLVTAGQDYLRTVQQVAEETRGLFQAQLEGVRQEQVIVRGEIAQLAQQLSSAAAEAATLQKRRELVSSGNLAPGATDPAVTELLAFAEEAQKERSHLPAPDYQGALGAVYAAWQEGRYGERTLRSLADAVWTQSGNPQTMSLAQHYHEAVRTVCVELVSAASERLNDPLLVSAARHLDPDRSFAFPSDNPLLTLEPLPLLEFAPKDGRIWGTLKKLFTGRALRKVADLWGHDGTQLIDAPTAVSFLREQADRFVAGIWGPPWDLKGRFEPRRVASVAVELFLAKLVEIWATLLAARLVELRGTMDHLQARRGERNQTLASFESQAAELEQTVRQHEAALADVARRSAALAIAPDPLKKLLTHLKSAPPA
jgi:hypothetical protein